MSIKLQIIICDKFKREVSSIIKDADFDDVMFSFFPSNCHMSQVDTSPLKKILNDCGKDSNPTCILCTQYIKGFERIQSGVEDSHTIEIERCFDIFCNNTLIDLYLKEGAYLLTPGWLKHWKQYIDDWGFDKDTARSFFGECSKNLILLDTGVYDKSAVDLDEFADYVGLPYEIVPVGLDYFLLFITKTISEWRVENKTKETNASLNNSKKKHADYAMFFDLIEKLANISAKSSTIESIFDIFAMFFAPERQIYISLEGDKPKEIYSNPKVDIDNERIKNILINSNEDYVITNTGNGFLLRIKHFNKTLGILEVEGITFPNYIERYSETALTIAGICGLIISNSRAYQKIIEKEEIIRKSEKELKGSERKMRALLENSPACTKVVDLDFNLQYMSSAGIKGLKIEDITQFYGKPYPFDFYPESFRNCMTNNLEKVKKTGGIITQEASVVDIDGNELWFHSTLVPVNDDEGKIDYIIVASVDITERKKTEDQIKSSLKEKEILLKEIHHRVKNNMQIISSLLKLQSENINDKRLLDLFQESQNRIKSMALIHEDLYQHNDLSKVDIDRYIRTLTGRLVTSFVIDTNRIITNINVDNIFLGIDVAIPCGLIINEFLTNSFKHAFPPRYDQNNAEDRNGKICIDFYSEDDKYTLIYSDNGVGLSENLDFQNTKTMGLNLINGLVKQINGTIEFNRIKETEFKIIFKA